MKQQISLNYLFLGTALLLSLHGATIFGMETFSEHPFAHEIEISQARKKYHTYLSQEKEIELKARFATRAPVDQKAFLPAYIASLSDETILSKKDKGMYLLYQTYTYALDQMLLITVLPEIHHKELVSPSLAKLYGQLQWFEKDENYLYFTPHVMFSMLFNYALLNDLAHNRPFYYLNPNYSRKDIGTVFGFLPDGKSNVTMEKHSKEMDESFPVSLYLFKNPDIKAPEISMLRKYFGQKDTVLLPVISKNGAIELNTFVYFLTQGFGLVGAGNTPASVHANSYPSIADLMYHDLLHMCLWIHLNENSLTLDNDLMLRKTFLDKAHEVFCSLLTEYTEAKNTNNQKRCLRIDGHIFFMFFMLHEIETSYKNFNPTLKKEFVSTSIDSFLRIKEKVEPLIDDEIVESSKIKSVLFNGIDSYFLLRKIFPTIVNDTMKKFHLSIKKSTLTKDDLSPITGKDMKVFFRLISDRMNSTSTFFISELEEKFEGTLPYTF